MKDELIKGQGIDPERASLLPGMGFFIPESVYREQKEKELETSLKGAELVVVTDSDADGLTCAALVQEYQENAICVPTSPYDLGDCISRVATHIEQGVKMYICDLCPDSVEEIEPGLRELCGKTDFIIWCDHHRWDKDIYDFVESLGVQVELGDSSEECAADVVFRVLNEDFSEKMKELVEVTRDHDLWLCEDDRSGYLADFAMWAPVKEYIEVVRECGADLPEVIISFLEENREEKNDLIGRAISRAEYKKIGRYTVGITYGKCSQNEVAEGIRREGADVCMIVKPTGGVSIRGSEKFERCHELARMFEGGGHPRAAGCMPIEFSDLLHYANHWISQGEETKKVLIEALEMMVRDGNAGG
jgi:oligoribonuclease NrnB/cAMP/cGMP phosphodiesterase (DHH superfamily)